MQSSSFKLEVVVNGQVIPEHVFQNRHFIESHVGIEYAIRITNWSGRKAAFVLSVDGRSVMTGQPASQNDSAYIVNPGDRQDIPGFRQGSGAVATFKFGHIEDSYAALVGSDENVGVIGAIVFLEKIQQPEIDMNESYQSKGLGTLGGAMRSGGGQRTGTVYGRSQTHRATTVQFEREELPSARLQIRYDDYRGLRQIGVQIFHSFYQQNVSESPNPFPGDAPFTPPPPRRR